MSMLFCAYANDKGEIAKKLFKFYNAGRGPY
jgi:hypothetical protein